MKYCPKCGSENKEEVKFCSKCGASFEKEVENEVKSNKPTKEGLGTASLVIGIIALVFSFTCIFFLPIFIILPLALVGLILGIVNKAKKGKKFAGIILNAFALVISIITCIMFFAILGITYNEATTSGTDLNKFINEIQKNIESSSVDIHINDYVE